jgi:hypothetical protein
MKQKFIVICISLTINAPLILKMRDIFFFAGKLMGHFKGYFEGAKTFLTPKIVPSAARVNLGVKKVEHSIRRGRVFKPM